MRVDSKDGPKSRMRSRGSMASTPAAFARHPERLTRSPIPGIVFPPTATRPRTPLTVEANAGDSGVLPDAGDSGVLSDAGDSGVASDAGDSGVLSDAGDSGTPKTGEHCPSWPTGSSDWDFTTGCSALDAGEVCAERQLGGGKKPDAPRSPSVVFASGQGANRELATRRRSAQCVLYANARKL